CGGQGHGIRQVGGRAITRARDKVIVPTQPSDGLSGRTGEGARRSAVYISPIVRMPAVTRRLLLESLSSLPLLSAALLAASQRADAKQASTSVYQHSVYDGSVSDISIRPAQPSD